MRRSSVAILAIVLLGAALRLWGIGHGIPFNVGVDEPQIVERSVAMMKTGDFNPHFFDYGGLTIYLNLAVASARFLTGAMAGQWASLADVWDGDFYLWGRVFTAVLGTLTVYVVYRIGARWSRTAGVAAALAMAVQPQHVQNAHFVLTDTPLTFFVALAMLFALSGEGDRLYWFPLAGLAAGLAAATKYNGAVAILLPLVMSVGVPSARGRMFAAGGTIGCAALGFLLAAPYSILDLPGFLNGFASLSQHYNRPVTVSEVAINYLKYIRNWSTWPGALPMMAAWPALAVMVVGCGVLLRQLFSVRALAAASVLVFTGVYFWLIVSQSLQFGRYALPIVPSLCLAFGLGAAAIERRWAAPDASRTVRRLAVMGLLVVLSPALGQAASYGYGRRKVGTEELAGRWIVANLPAGQRIVVESTSLRLPPRVLHENVLRLMERSAEQYRDAGVLFLASSSQETDKYFADPQTFAGQVTKYNELFRASSLVTVFRPSDDHPGPTIRIYRLNAP